MSAGFDACNLNPVPLEFVGGPQNTQPRETQSTENRTPLADPAEFSKAAFSEQAYPEEDSRESVSQPATVSLPKNLQRVAEAREQQGFSLRTISRRTGIDLRTLRSHELPTADLKLSELRAWQQALEVPLVDLLEDDLQPLSSPVRDRAMLVRIMKTVMAIKEAGGSPRIQRLADMLHEQMISLMPELKEIGAWPQHGGRRSSGSSRIVEQQVNTKSLGTGED
ncbi:MAG: helix-turn-helix transcriptional regulator [Pirellulaceae bacterium]|nr:helix-turn-helix transcriptional regulator [Pirellulaceae bacterium]